MPNRKIDFGGNKSIRTLGDFGCNCWTVDTRSKQDGIDNADSKTSCNDARQAQTHNPEVGS